MGALHGIVTSGDYFAFDLIVYTTGLLVTVLLLVLTLRAAKLPGTSLANIGFAACALLWTAGGLANALLLASGLAPGGWPALVAQAVQYSGGAVFPILILAIWRPFAARAWQKTTVGILQIPLFIVGQDGILGWYPARDPGATQRVPRQPAPASYFLAQKCVFKEKRAPRGSTELIRQTQKGPPENRWARE
jgi:hypothetical protein